MPPDRPGPPKVLERTVHFRVADPERRWEGVRLVTELPQPHPTDLAWHDGEWVLRWPRPRLLRLEYQLEIRWPGGHTERITDPDNPLRVRTLAGERSLVEMPGYLPPWWLTAQRVPGSVQGLLWSPEDATPEEPLPLLVVHDGPAYAELADLTTYSAALVACRDLPRHRLALLGSPEQDAGPLAQAVEAARGPVVVMGGGAGAVVALLDAVRSERAGGAFGQSGTFADLPPDALAAAGSRSLRVGLTCGALESVVADNRDTAALLTRAGHDVTYGEVADLSGFTAWRDAFDPFLTGVLQDVWG